MGFSLSAIAALASQFPLSEHENRSKGYELHRDEVAQKVLRTDAGVALLRELVHHVQIKGKVLHLVLLFVIAVLGFVLIVLIVLLLLLRFLLTAARAAAAATVIEEQTVVSEFKVNDVLYQSLSDTGLTQLLIDMTSLQLIVDQSFQRAIFARHYTKKTTNTSR